MIDDALADFRASGAASSRVLGTKSRRKTGLSHPCYAFSSPCVLGTSCLTSSFSPHQSPKSSASSPHAPKRPRHPRVTFHSPRAALLRSTPFRQVATHVQRSRGPFLGALDRTGAYVQRSSALVLRGVSGTLSNPYALSLAAVVALLAFTLAWTVASRRKDVQIRRLKRQAAAQAARPMSVAAGDGVDDNDSAGDNALWLNLSLFPSAWRLFRKNTASLISDTLQPILDTVELPDFVKKVDIVSLTIGSRPPLVRKIRRLPSRARSELQYSFRGRLVGDLKINLMVKLKVGFLEFSCPVSVTDLDLDGIVWCGFTLMPAAPFVRRIQWALLKLPTVKLSIKVANVIPVTTIPLLSQVLNRLFTKTVPREFLLPRTQIIDLEQEIRQKVDKSNSDLRDAFTVTADGDIGDAKYDELKTQYPSLWALFDSMDEDRSGNLTLEEVVTGLSSDWGFASTSIIDKEAMFRVLDEDDNGKVSFPEFVKTWPDLRSVFVPRRFDGVVAGVLLKGRDLPVPKWGFSDPYVVFTVEQTSVASMKNSETSKRGKLPSDAVWNETFEIEIQNPATAQLTITVREGGYCFGFSDRPALKSADGASWLPPASALSFKGRVLGTGRIKVHRLRDGKSLRLWVPLDQGGNILVDMNYSQYVDPRPL